MAKKVIHKNPHLKKEDDRLERVARSAATSAGIEGIKISVKETRRMAEEVAKKSALRK